MRTWKLDASTAFLSGSMIKNKPQFLAHANLKEDKLTVELTLYYLTDYSEFREALYHFLVEVITELDPEDEIAKYDVEVHITLPEGKTVTFNHRSFTIQSHLK